MRIGLIGLGSIGQRHMRNLLEMGEEDLFAFDPRIGQEDFSCAPIQGTNSIDLLWAWQPEALLICSPPDTHYTFLSIAPLHHVKHVFVEKPLAHTWDHAHMFTECNKVPRWGLTVAVGYQLRWQLDSLGFGRFGKDMLFECSQNMAEWPSRYEKDVLLEFSHEIDAAIYLGGPVEKVWAEEFSAGWQLHLAHLHSVSTINLNPFSKSAVREMHILNNDHTLPVWQFSQTANDQAYKKELAAFLAICRGGAWDERLCTLAQAAHVMKIIDACKRSAKNCEVVQL